MVGFPIDFGLFRESGRAADLGSTCAIDPFGFWRLRPETVSNVSGPEKRIDRHTERWSARIQGSGIILDNLTADLFKHLPFLARGFSSRVNVCAVKRRNVKRFTIVIFAVLSPKLHSALGTLGAIFTRSLRKENASDNSDKSCKLRRWICENRRRVRKQIYSRLQLTSISLVSHLSQLVSSEEIRFVVSDYSDYSASIAISLERA